MTEPVMRRMRVIVAIPPTSRQYGQKGVGGLTANADRLPASGLSTIFGFDRILNGSIAAARVEAARTFKEGVTMIGSTRTVTGTVLDQTAKASAAG
jgi:hypothetical protein